MCVLFFTSGLTALATYFLTKELWNSGAGLFAACFIAIGKTNKVCSVTKTYTVYKNNEHSKSEL